MAQDLYDRSVVLVDENGNFVNGSNPLAVTSSGGGGGGTSQVDKTQFIEGTGQFTPVGGVFNETAVADPNEDQAAAARITAKRGLHVNLRTAGGVELGTSGQPLRTDPTGTTAQPVTDNGASLTVDDGGITLSVDDGGSVLSVDDGGGSLTVDIGSGDNTIGRVKITDGSLVASVRDTGSNDSLNVAIVDGSGNQITTFGGGVQYTEGDTDATITGTAVMFESDTGTNRLDPVSVDKPLPIDQVNTASLDYDTGVGTVNQSVVGIALPGSGGPVAGGTASNPVRTDPTGTTAQPVTDNGGSLTVDGTVTITDGGGSISVDDNGGSLTIDGSVSIASALPAGNNNIGDVDVASLPAGSVAAATAKTLDYDTGGGTDTVPAFGVLLPKSGGAVAGGTATDPLRVDPTGTTAQPVTDNGGTLTVDDGGSSLTVDGTVTVQDGGGSISVDDNGGSLTVDGTVAATQSGSWTVTADAGVGTFNVDQANAAEADYDTGGGTVNQVMFGLALPASGGPVPGGTATAPVRVDPTGTTAQPVTDNGTTLSVDDGGGSLTVDIGSGDNTIGRVKLTDGTDVASIRDLANSDPLDVAIVDGSGNQITSFGGGTQYTEGDTDASITGTAVMWEDASDTLRAVSASKPLPVSPPTPSTATRTTVAASTSVVTLLAANSSRKGATIWHDGAQKLFVALGSSATLSDFTMRLNPQEYYEVPFGYTGVITGIWNVADGNALVTELT